MAVLVPLQAARLLPLRDVGKLLERLPGPALQFALLQDEVVAAGLTDHGVEVVLDGFAEMDILLEGEIDPAVLGRIRQHRHVTVHHPLQEIGADQVVGEPA